MREDWPTPTGGWPSWVAETPYVGARHPQAPPRPFGEGANCQRYAYAVLKLFGRVVPSHRSSELWSDGRFEHPLRAADLDLALFAAAAEPWGAHVAVVLGGSLLHLSAEVGKPAVWSWADFANSPRYHTLVGLVRVPQAGGGRQVADVEGRWRP